MTDPTAGHERRIAELEIKLVDAEDTLEALNLTVFRQQRLIERLERDIAALRQQIAASPAGEALSLRDELPPHY